jgi:hypothetical protein
MPGKSNVTLACAFQLFSESGRSSPVELIVWNVDLDLGLLSPGSLLDDADHGAGDNCDCHSRVEGSAAGGLS